MKYVRVIRVIAAGCICIIWADPAVCGQMKTITVTAKDPRPLSELARQLERLSGVPICFEDV
ncbi:MAG: hypothetical protein ABFD86_00705 [Bryobacteraceae bacterium]